MPNGQVQWVDDDRQAVHILRRGRSFIAPLAEVESRARVPGVRVHFEIRRHDGVESAAKVMQREGSRTNRRHRRFGDLTGAHQPGAKVDALPMSLFGVDVTTQPVAVTEAWLQALADQDVDGARSLYAPDCTIHTTSGDRTGQSQRRAFLSDHRPTNFIRSAVTVAGADALVRVVWPQGTRFGTSSPEPGDTSTFLRIDHGQITEQWHLVASPLADKETSRPPLEIVVKGQLAVAERESVEAVFDHFLSSLPQPPLHAIVKLSTGQHAGRANPINASATIDHRDGLLRAHVGADNATVAAELLSGKLWRQLDRRRQTHHKAHASGSPGPAGLETLETPARTYFDRPAEDRELVRHKSFAPSESTVEEAMWDMAMLDYDFFLFCELTTGSDCLLSRSADGYTLRCLRQPNGGSALATLATEVDPTPVATMSVAEAIARLNLSGDVFEFFGNPATQRGNVVYRRYDGHYGLLTPPGPEKQPE